MSILLQEANLELSKLTQNGRVATPDELKSLAARVSIETTGNTTVLYSGLLSESIYSGSIIQSMIDSGQDVRVIDQTDAAKFLSSIDFRTEWAASYGLTLIQYNAVENSHPAKQALFSATNGPWADASKRFVEATTGSVRTLVPNAGVDRVFAQTELPALLNNANITDVDGISIEEIKAIEATRGLDGVRDFIFDHSYFQANITGLSADNVSTYLQLEPGEGAGTYTDLLKDPQKLKDWNAAIDELDEARATRMRSLMTSAIYVSEELIDKGSSVANKLGPVGLAIGFTLAASQASAAEEAGNSALARDIMINWAADSAGSVAGEAAGAALGTVAIAALAAAGVTLSAPLAGAVVIGAALIGGFIGADGATSLYELTKDQDENGRSDIIDHLGRLLFGDSYTITTPPPESLVNQQLNLQTPLSPDTIIDNAQTSIAWRYALHNLIPFAIEGDDAIYQAFNQNGELDLSNYSEQYLLDRAQFLAYIFERNTREDIPESAVILDVVMDTYSDNRLQEGLTVYPLKDSGTNLILTENGGSIHGTSNDERRFIKFGSNNNEVLEGNKNNDSLYGLAGNDELIGGQGDDYLEGGEGNDIYRFNYGDGRDVVFDRTGTNDLYFQHSSDEGLSRLTELSLLEGSTSLYVQLDPQGKPANNTTYMLVNAPTDDNPTQKDLLVIVDGGNGGTIRIVDWQPDRFGVTINSQTTAEPPAPLTTQTLANLTVDGLTDPPPLHDTEPDEKYIEVWQGFSDANVTVSGNDRLQGGSFTDHLMGYGGDDYISTGTNDTFAQYGNQYRSAYAASNVDVAHGGKGDDRVIGSDDREFLYGNTEQYAFINLFRVFAPVTITSAFDLDTKRYVTSGAAPGSFSDNDYLHGYGGNDLVEANEGDDIAYGGDGDDVVSGGAGSDRLFGGEGSDNVFGDGHVTQLLSPSSWDLAGTGIPEGRSSFLGTLIDQRDGYHSYDDFIDGGAGTDWLVGGLGSDTVIGGEGNDTIEGDQDGQGRNKDLDFVDEDGVDRLYIHELAQSDHGEDVLSGEAGDDYIAGNGKGDVIDGGADNDLLEGDSYRLDAAYHGNDAVLGGDGNDTIFGQGGADTLEGGAGDDLIDGDVLQSRTFTDIYGQSHSMTIAEDYHSNDIILGGAGNDTLRGNGGADDIDGGADDDIIYGDDAELDESWHGNDTLSGGDGNDQLAGFAGNDSLNGGRGSDLLFGGKGQDTLVGGRGIDQLDGEEGNDTYYFSVGDSTIGANGYGDLYVDTQGSNTLYFNQVSISDFRIQDNDQGDMFISYSDNDLIAITFDAFAAIDTLVFEGNSISQEEALYFSYLNYNGESLEPSEGNDVLIGGPGDNTINAGAGDDAIYTGSGNDVITGGGGRDTYWVDDNPGILTIHLDAGNTDSRDVLQFFDGVFTRDIVVKRLSEDSLNITINEDGLASRQLYVFGFTGDEFDKVYMDGFTTEHDAELRAIESKLGLISGTLVPPYNQRAIEDSSFLREESLKTTNGNDTVYGYNAYKDVITGGEGGDELYGLDGNDTLYGEDGSDRLEGGDGKDSLIGGGGNDTLVGGSGSDLINGGEGANTYYYRLGDDNDTINGSTSDELVLENVAPEDVIVRGVEYHDAKLYFSDGGSILLTDYFNGNPLQAIRFSDGTSWDYNTLLELGNQREEAVDYLGNYNGRETGQEYFTQDGNDLIQISANDTVHAGEGNDTINDYFAGIGANSLYGDGGNDVIDLSNVDSAGGNILDGGEGIDTLQGSAGNDTFYNGEHMSGYGGDDVYVIERGFNDITINAKNTNHEVYTPNFEKVVSSDIIQFGAGITPEDVTFSAIRTEYYGREEYVDITIAGNGQYPEQTVSVRVSSQDSDTAVKNRFFIGGVQFEDGTFLSASDIASTIDFRWSATPTGSSINERNNIIEGSPGNDYFSNDSEYFYSFHTGPGHDQLFASWRGESMQGSIYYDGEYIQAQVLDGGTGSDLYGVFTGSSAVIVESEGDSGDNDALLMSGLYSVRFGKDGDDLVVYDRGYSGDGPETSYRIANSYRGVGWGIETFFWQQSSITKQQIESVVAGGAIGFNDTLYYSSSSDVSIQAGTLLANDFDNLRGDAFITSVSNVSHGSVFYDSVSGTIQLSLGDGFQESVTFDYTLSTPAGIDNTATVTLSFNSAPELRSDLNASIVFEEANDGARYLDLSPLFTDAQGDRINYSFALADEQANGDWLNGYNQLVVAPDAPLGVHTVTVTVTDVKSAPVDINVDVSITESGVFLLPYVHSSSDQQIFGDGGNNELIGDVGNDTIYGEAGNDTISGADGDDQLYGGEGSNILNGEAGNDSLYATGSGGEDQTDILNGGTGHDALYSSTTGNGQQFVMTGGEGDDTYYISANALSQYGGGIIDNTDASGGQDVIVLGTGIHPDDVQLTREEKTGFTIFVNGEPVVVKGLASRYTSEDATNDYNFVSAIKFADHPDVVWDQVEIRNRALESLDFYYYSTNADSGNGLYGYSTDDEITGSDLASSIYGGDGNDTINGAGGYDWLHGEAGDDLINGGAGNDLLTDQAGDDTLNGGADDDWLQAAYGNNELNGGDGNDYLEAYGNDNATDILNGDAGNDELHSSGSKRFEMNGGEGDDTYHVSANSFQHGGSINNADASDGNDVLVLGHGINPEDVEITRSAKTGLSLFVRSQGLASIDVNGLAGRTVVEDATTDYNLLSAIKFSSHPDVVWDRAEIQARSLEGVDFAYASPHADSNNGLYGYSTDDVITGNDLSSTIYGGDGNDTINGAGGYDRLHGEAGDDLINGGAGNDLLSDQAGDDTLNGGADDDYLYAADGNNELNGGDGNDYLEAYGNDDATDIMNGGAGNDEFHSSGSGKRFEMSGGEGDDTYYVSANSFQYGGSINNTDASDGNDVLVLGHGINPEDVEITRSARNGLSIFVRSQGFASIDVNGFAGRTVVEDTTTDNNLLSAIKFSSHPDVVWDQAEIQARSLQGVDFSYYSADADSSNGVYGYSTDDDITGNDFASDIYGGDGNDTIDGAGGDDFLSGEAGDDVINGDSGNDQLYAGSGNNTLNGGEDNDGLYGGSGHDILNGGTGEDLLYGFGGDDNLYGDSGNDQLFGADGEDNLYGGDGDDLLDGGSGLDDLNGGTGNDTYVFSGDFDIARINNGNDYIGSTNIGRFDDVDASQLWFSQQGNDLSIAVIGTDNQVIVRDWYVAERNQLDQVHIGADILLPAAIKSLVDITTASGIELSTVQDPVASATIPAAVLQDLANTIAGSVVDSNSPDLATTEIGTSGDDTIEGFGGDDYLEGLAGNDLLDGGDHIDTLVGGDGNDTLYGGAGSDARLSGDNGDDIINGGAGDDYLSGGAGNDTYEFDGDFGQDRVWNTTSGYFDTDVIRFNDLTYSDLWFSQSGSDLVINVAGSDNQVTIKYFYSATANRVEQFEVGDRQLFDTDIDTLVTAMSNELSAAGLTVADIMQNGIPATVATNLESTLTAVWKAEGSGDGADTLQASDAGEVLEGFGGNDVLIGGAGNDTLLGGTGQDNLSSGFGNDSLEGGADNDDLNGGWGDDTLIGGAGSDYLVGDIGNDLYLFSGDFGYDRINNNDWSDSVDTAQFDGVTVNDLWFSEQGNDLLINVLDQGVATDNSVVVRNWYNENAVNQFLDQFKADNLVLDQSNVNALVQAMASVSTGAPADVNNLSQEDQNTVSTAITTAWEAA